VYEWWWARLSCEAGAQTHDINAKQLVYMWVRFKLPPTVDTSLVCGDSSTPHLQHI
jgi:hypothetical protein